MDQISSSEQLVLLSSDPMELRMKFAIVQVLVWFFIYIDIFMLFTFFSKQAFHSDTRYILFAHTLLMDSILLLLTDLVVLLSYFYIQIPVGHSCARAMDQNSSSEELILIDRDPKVLRVKTAIVQVLVWFFVYIDIFMLFTFFSKQAFRGDARYILFAHTLLMDSTLLLLTDLVVLLSYFHTWIPVSHCIALCFVMGISIKNTPYTITAMCLERYVAICMPLRHASISTTGRAIAAIIIIWAFSSVKVIIDLVIVTVTAPPSYFAMPSLCNYQIMLVTEWQHRMHVTFSQMDFFIIAVIVLFCYAKLMLAAQAASGENKQSVSKGRRTLLLHGVQLFLSMANLWVPFILDVVRKQSQYLFLPVRFFNFIAFTIFSRALSPLIYGLRDKEFSLALKYYMRCRASPSLEKHSS
ncbi:odorant receptor 131-2-like [Conger conger]|uniref:odorant receptor 131-2-like n=1 Tax=Conger conger TaxID=82655 RepID=UPI002A5ADC72|nr:odorant receptor 131-2-like [Conger conger]